MAWNSAAIDIPLAPKFVHSHIAVNKINRPERRSKSIGEEKPVQCRNDIDLFQQGVVPS